MGVFMSSHRRNRMSFRNGCRLAFTFIAASAAGAACSARDELPLQASTEAASLPPGLVFQLPFHEGQEWTGATYEGHNGNNPGGMFSIDFTYDQGSSEIGRAHV